MLTAAIADELGHRDRRSRGRQAGIAGTPTTSSPRPGRRRVVELRLAGILGEIQSGLAYWMAQSERPLRRIVLTGGGARAGDIAGRLALLVGAPVEWGVVQGLEAPEAAAGAGDWADHTVAAGLALGATAAEWQIDLCPPVKRSFRFTGDMARRLAVAAARGRRPRRRDERPLRPGAAQRAQPPRRPAEGHRQAWRRRSASTWTSASSAGRPRRRTQAGAVGPGRRRVVDPVPRRPRPDHAPGAWLGSLSAQISVGPARDRRQQPPRRHRPPRLTGRDRVAAGLRHPASTSRTPPTGSARSPPTRPLAGLADRRCDEDRRGQPGRPWPSRRRPGSLPPPAPTGRPGWRRRHCEARPPQRYSQGVGAGGRSSSRAVMALAVMGALVLLYGWNTFFLAPQGQGEGRGPDRSWRPPGPRRQELRRNLAELKKLAEDTKAREAELARLGRLVPTDADIAGAILALDETAKQAQVAWSSFVPVAAVSRGRRGGLDRRRHEDGRHLRPDLRLPPAAGAARPAGRGRQPPADGGARRRQRQRAADARRRHQGPHVLGRHGEPGGGDDRRRGRPRPSPSDASALPKAGD